MIADVSNALRDIAGSSTQIGRALGPGRAFELYIMTGIARALKTRGYDVWIRRSDGTRIHPANRNRRFVQRSGAPAGVPSAAQGPNNASSIAFRRGRRPRWELLNGVQFTGRSGAHHEIDIAIVPESVVVALRNSPTGGRPLGRPRVSIECKDVGRNGSVDEMRTFVARLYDLTLLRTHHPYLPVAGPPRAIHPGAPPQSIHRPVRSYRQENHRTLNVLARRTGFAIGTAALSNYHAVAPHKNITVGSASAAKLMDDVADWILHRGY